MSKGHAQQNHISTSHNTFIRTKSVPRDFFYLINSESNLNWSILVNFCHDVIGIRVDSICTDTETFRLPPEQVLVYTLPCTLWCRICRLTTRVRASTIIKIWITLPEDHFEIYIRMQYLPWMSSCYKKVIIFER